MKNAKILLCGIVIGMALWAVGGQVYDFLAANPALSIGKTMSTNAKVNAIYRILDTYYVGEYDKASAQEGIFDGLVYSVGDRYTTYLDAETLTAYRQSVEGTYAGIGVLVTVDEIDNNIIIVSVFENSPAQKAGLLPDDRITAVDGAPVSGVNYTQAADMLKGAPGTDVTVTIHRPGEDRYFDTVITREIVDIPTVFQEMLENNVGYIKITSFDAVTAKQFQKSYEELTNEGMRALILDVRDNPGGIMQTVCEIADILVDTEFIVYTEDKAGEREYVYGDTDRIDIPLVVLINGGSASASEVLAGAVKDTGTGILVGEKTYGKGVVQSIFSLPDSSGIKVTVAKYYTPSGICIDGIGIEPDYEVILDKKVPSGTDINEDEQLKKAYEVALGG